MRRVLLAVSSGVALIAAATSASAQWYGEPSWAPYRYNAPPPPYGYGRPDADRPLPREVVVDRLEREGYEDIGRVRFDGSVYTIEATTPRGEPVRLVVDAYRGRVLREAALRDTRFGRLDEGDFDQPRYERRGRAPSPFPDETSRGQGYLERPGGGVLPDQEAAIPPDTGVRTNAPLLVRPADPRLAPSPGPGGVAEPAPRSESARPPAARGSTSSPSGVYGVNPGTGARTSAAPDVKPSLRPSTRPSVEGTGEKAKASPTPPPPEPVPSVAAAKPAPGPAVASETHERKPVRVIPGVTPMNGGEQSSPAPQNGLQAGSSQPAAK